MVARKSKASAPQESPGAEEPGKAQTVPAAQETEEHPRAPAPAEAKTNEEEPMQNSIENGRSIDYTPTADVMGGDLIVFPAMVAVAATDIKTGETGACETEGVFDLPKDGTALAKGQAVFATAAGIVTATESGNTPAGKCWADAAGGDATVAVKINT